MLLYTKDSDLLDQSIIDLDDNENLEDLKLAKNFNGNIPQVYTMQDILTLSDRTAEQFAQVFRIPIDENIRLRVLHILDIKGYLDHNNYGFFLDRLSAAKDHDYKFYKSSLRTAEKLYKIYDKPIRNVVYEVGYTSRLVNNKGRPIVINHEGENIGNTLWGSNYGQLIFIANNIYKKEIQLPHMGEDGYVGYSTNNIDNALNILTNVIERAEHAGFVNIDNIYDVSYDSKTSTVAFIVDTESGQVRNFPSEQFIKMNNDLA